MSPRHSSKRFPLHREQGGGFHPLSSYPYLIGIIIGGLVFAFLYAAVAKAETGVRVVLLTGPYALSRQDLGVVLAMAAYKLELGNKPIKVKKILTFPDPCTPQNTRENFPNQFGCFRSIAERLRRFREGPTLVVSPPMSARDGQLYLGGVAQRVCTRHVSRRISWVAATPASILGSSRIYSSAIGIAHELGHNFGAGHVSDASIMNEGALVLARNGLDLFFSPQSISEMNQCKNRGAF